MFSAITKSKDQDINRSTLLMRLGLLGIISFLLALAGPFGTFQAGEFLDRLLYWSILSGVSASIAWGVKGVVMKRLTHLPFVRKECVVILATTLLLTPFLWIWTMLVFPGQNVAAPNMIWMGGIVLLVCVSISALLHRAAIVMKYANSPVESAANVARIVKRLPETFEGKIIHLTVDGHIVRVITDADTFELRMRFADAVDEVSELDGIFTHRSHWVALAEIANVGSVNGRPCLLMSNGEEVPVSRKYQPALEALGIL